VGTDHTLIPSCYNFADMVERKSGVNPEICIWCVNNNRDVCVERCRQESKYRYLEPEALEPWEEPPELPRYRELVDEEPYAVRAIVWLNAYYRDPRNNGRNNQ
jgi:hypothetical protein